MRILIVEDDPDGREMLAELFRLQRWDVTDVGTAHDAIDELRAGGFDVVISDENLEGESGSTMLREAFDSGLLEHVGALMYTAQPGKLDVPPGVRVLRKPLGLPKLLDEAKAVAAIPASPDGASAAPGGDAAPKRQARVQLELYVTDSASSQRAVAKIERLLARSPENEVELTVHHLDETPLDAGANDDRVALTPMLVKRGPGAPERFLGDLATVSLATLLDLDDAPPSSRAVVGHPPSSRA